VVGVANPPPGPDLAVGSEDPRHIAARLLRIGSDLLWEAHLQLRRDTPRCRATLAPRFEESYPLVSVDGISYQLSRAGAYSSGT